MKPDCGVSIGPVYRRRSCARPAVTERDGLPMCRQHAVAYDSRPMQGECVTPTEAWIGEVGFAEVNP